MKQMGEVALADRRVQGDAALDQNRMRAQIEAEIQDILDEAADVDEAEDEEYCPENRGDELSEELRDKESHLERLCAAKAKLDEKEQWQKENQAENIRQHKNEEAESGEKLCGRKPMPPEAVELDEDTKANTTDPERQTMKSHDG